MGAPSSSGESFEPAVVGFFCEKCGDGCLPPPDESGGELPDTLKRAQTLCVEKVGPDLIRQAFEYGADGVLVCGCMVGECEALQGNAAVLSHIHRSKLVLSEMGIAPGRLHHEWTCSPDVENIRDIFDKFVARICALGKLELPKTGVIEKSL